LVKQPVAWAQRIAALNKLPQVSVKLVNVFAVKAVGFQNPNIFLSFRAIFCD
jgi:hypothetical protein